jgi:prophage regulatory protein
MKCLCFRPEASMSTREILRRERKRKNTKRRDRAEGRVRRVLRLPEVEKLVGLKHATIYGLMSQGLFPTPIPLSKRAVAWVEGELIDWLEARIAERDSGSVVRSLPLAGLKQRRKIEASPQPDVRNRRRTVRRGGRRETVEPVGA